MKKRPEQNNLKNDVKNGAKKKRQRKKKNKTQENYVKNPDIPENKTLTPNVTETNPFQITEITYDKNAKSKKKNLTKVQNLNMKQSTTKNSSKTARNTLDEAPKKKKKFKKVMENNNVDSSIEKPNKSKKQQETNGNSSVVVNSSSNLVNQSLTSVKKNKNSHTKSKLKEVFKNILADDIQRNKIEISSNSSLLRARMMERLNSARFRYINEKLYLSDGKDAHSMFKSDPDAFKVYHDGYRQQVKKWPINPLDIIVKDLKNISKNSKVADLGCGEGALAKRVSQSVRSFDLVSTQPHVEECDMAHTPLLTGEMDVVVYCLALMGTNLKEFLVEANRILKNGGLLKIAEVESRFDDVNGFLKDVEKYGFQNTKVNDSHSVFYFFDFKKVRDIGKNRSKLPKIQLKACMYKKR